MPEAGCTTVLLLDRPSPVRKKPVNSQRPTPKPQTAVCLRVGVWALSRSVLDVLNGQNPYKRVKFLRSVQDVYARPEGGQEILPSSEAEPHARRSEAEPR